MRTVVTRVGTGLALVLLFAVLAAPADMRHLSPAAFLRLPLDGLLGVALVLLAARIFAQRPRAQRITVWTIGGVLGLLAVIKLISLGFSQVLDRPFDPVLDWPFLGSGYIYLRESSGRGTALGVLVLVVVAGLALAGLVALCFRWVSTLAGLRPLLAARGTAVLGVAWLLLAVLGVQLVPDVPVSGHDAYDRAAQVVNGVRDRAAFAEESKVDAFREVPADRLLTGLRGKDVVLTFVESYGRVALDDPEISPRITSLLDDGAARLAGKGYQAKSAFLSSPTAGGGSWLAQSTLVSGLWIDNQQRYRELVTTDRMTLNAAFRKASWRTVAVMPATIAAWPEGKFFGFDRIYAAKDLDYQGPRYSFAQMPDQFTLSRFQRTEREAAGRAPVMAEIPLISSHSPWEPVPTLMDWSAVGDGSGFEAKAGFGDSADVVMQRDRDRVRADYRDAIAYSLETLLSYVETYGDDNLVMVFLGDHQPSPAVTGSGASRDVPITIVAKDPAIWQQIADWGWSPGLRPGPGAPHWRMDAFRDRFLTAFSR